MMNTHSNGLKSNCPYGVGSHAHAILLALLGAAFAFPNVSAWLDRGRKVNDENRQFLNGRFVNNATIEAPDYTLGVFVGVSAARTGISSGFRSGERANAFDSEIHFRIPVFDGAGYMTPSIQYVEGPGFDASETVPSSIAVVTGLRFHYSF